MIRRVILRPAALRDIEDTFDYFVAKSAAAAQRFVDACIADCNCLAEHPGVGGLREFRNPRLTGMRSSSVTGFANYLIFYRAVDVGIEVVRLLHGARDIDTIFEAD